MLPPLTVFAGQAAHEIRQPCAFVEPQTGEQGCEGQQSFRQFEQFSPAEAQHVPSVQLNWQLGGCGVHGPQSPWHVLQLCDPVHSPSPQHAA